MNRDFLIVTAHPCDSLQAMLEIDPGLVKTFATCSAPGDGGGLGCSFHRNCEFRLGKKNLREQTSRASGEKVMREVPIRVAIAKKFPNGVQNVLPMSCWDYYRNGSQADRDVNPGNRRENKTKVAVIGYEGDTVKQRSRVRSHIPPQPTSCDGCRRGACTEGKEDWRPLKIERLELYSDGPVGSDGGQDLDKMIARSDMEQAQEFGNLVLERGKPEVAKK